MKAGKNPFRTERLMQVRYRLHGASWVALLQRFEQFRFRGAIIGRHGSGKTTLLEDVGARLRRSGLSTQFLRLDADQRTFPKGFMEDLAATLGPNDILLFDGAEQLAWAAWLWFRWRTRRAGGLLITTHRPGRLPTLWECRTSPELLRSIAAELLGRGEHGLTHQAQTLHAAHAGNLRDALREWYDIYAAA